MSQRQPPTAPEAGPPLGILTTDTELVVKSWDGALEAMTGVSAASAVGKSLLDIIPDLGNRPVLALLREPLASGAAQVIAPALHKYLIPCPPARPSAEFACMQQRVVSAALRDEEHIVGLLVTVEDVTERIEQERALSRRLRAADPVDRMAAVKHLSTLPLVDGPGALASAMADDDWQVRRAAVRALADRRDTSLVEGIVHALREGHRNFSLLSSALQLLAITGGDITDALIGLMRDPDPDLRIQVALALGSQQRPEATAALLDALDDPDPNVRFHAIEALGNTAATVAIEPLTRIAESDDFFLAFPAIEALVRINDPVAVPRLVHLLAKPLLASAVVHALGQIGDDTAVAPLVDALGGRAPVAEVADALAAVHERYHVMFGHAAEIETVVRQRLTPEGLARLLSAINTESGSTLRHVIVVVGWVNDPSVPAVLARIVGSADARHEVVEALVRFGSSSVDLLVDRLHGIDDETARDAVTALGRIGDRRAVPALLGLLDEGHRRLWVPIANACARIGDPRAFEAMLRLLGDEDASVRQAAVGALNSIGHADMDERIRMLLSAPEPRVRESAVKVAGYFGYECCAAAVLDLCGDEDEAVRCATLEHLPYFDHPGAVAALSRALAHDTARARASAAHALGTVAESDAIPLLARAIEDPEPWVRYFAARSLGRHPRAPRAVEWLVGAIADSAPHVRVAAVEALGVIGGAAAATALDSVMRDDPGEPGHTAARLIGASHSPDAVPALMAALRSPDPVRRLAAIDGFATHSSTAAVEHLKWTAETDADDRVRRRALSSLATVANGASEAGRSALDALIQCLAEPRLRDAAIDELSRIRATAIPMVADALSIQDPVLRRGVAEALSRMAHPIASAALHRALDDSDEAVRRRAIAALSRVGSRELQRRLVTMAQKDPSTAVRQVAAAALRRGNTSTEADGAHA